MSAATTTRPATVIAAIVALVASMVVLPLSPAAADVAKTDFDGRFNADFFNINDGTGDDDGFVQNDAGVIGEGGTLDVVDVGKADLDNIHIAANWDGDGDAPPVEQSDIDLSYCGPAMNFNGGETGFSATCNSPGDLDDIDGVPLSVDIDIDDGGEVHQQTIELGTYTVNYPDLELTVGDTAEVQLEQLDPDRYSFEVDYAIGNGYTTNSADVTVGGIDANCDTGQLTGDGDLSCTVDDEDGDLSLWDEDADVEMTVDAVNAPAPASDTTTLSINLDPSVEFDGEGSLSVDGEEFAAPADVIVGAHVDDGLEVDGSFTVTNDGNMVLNDVLVGLYGEVQFEGASGTDEPVTDGLCPRSGMLPVGATLSANCDDANVAHTDGYVLGTLANLGPYLPNGGDWNEMTDDQSFTGLSVGFTAFIVDGGLDFDAELSDGDNTFDGSAAFDTVLASEWVDANPDVDTDVTDTVSAIHLGAEDGPSVGTPSALERDETVEFWVDDIDGDVDVTTAYVTFDVSEQQRWGTGNDLDDGDVELSEAPEEDGATITVPVTTGLTYDDGTTDPTPPDDDGDDRNGDADNGDADEGDADEGEQPLTIDCVDNPTDFGDVADGAVHGFAIECLGGDDGLFRGTADGNFDQSGSLTRGQKASVLYRALTRAGVGIDDGEHTFEDVPADATHGDAIGALTAAGIISGYNGDEFGPNDPVTRAQLASLIDRANSEYGVAFDRNDDHGFADVADDGTHASAIGALAGAGVVQGYTGTVFGPGDEVRRDQAATMFTRWLVPNGENGNDS